MLLSELFDSPKIPKFGNLLGERSRQFWSQKIQDIMEENKGPVIKTHIKIKKGRKDA